MNIAYLANVRFPSERAHSFQINSMCEAYTLSSHQVSLFVKKNEDDSMVASHNFNVVRFSSPRLFVNSKASFYFNEFYFTLCFWRFKNSGSFDMILSRSEAIIFFLSLLLDPRKLLWESHDMRSNFFAKRIIKKKVKIVVTSIALRDEYRSVLHAQKVLLAENAIDDNFFTELESKKEARSRLGITTSKKVVMYIGGFDHWKGVDVFCAASIYCTDYLFVVIGGSDYETKNMMSQYPGVVFLGRQPFEDLKDNQQAADFLIVPNRPEDVVSTKYTSPLKLFAHMVSGIPLIVSNLPSITNIVSKDSVSLFESGNAKNLADTIISVDLNYKTFKKTAEVLMIASKNNTWNTRAKKIVAFNQNTK